MVRMSDILKRAKEKERKAREEKERKAKQQDTREKSLPIESARQETPPEPVKPVKEVARPETKAREVEKPKVERQPELKEQEKKKSEISEVRISPVVMKGTRVASSEESLNLYEESVSLVREVLKENINHESIDAKRITTQVEKIIEQLNLNNEKLTELTLIKEAKDENYIFCHSLNVCIYSIILGSGLGYGKPELTELGISALLHDIGMTDFLHLSMQPRKLTTREYSEIKRHPIKGVAILEKIKTIIRSAVYAAEQHHERMDGSGYPRSLKKADKHLTPYAKIISVADTYEAMVHPRAYRKEYLPTEAMREILSKKETFKYELLKILIEKIGIFPIGSIVGLNTKEIAQVVKLNRTVPLRPVVKVIFGADGKELKETKTLNLTTQPTICIRKAIRKSELKILPTR